MRLVSVTNSLSLQNLLKRRHGQLLVHVNYLNLIFKGMHASRVGAAPTVYNLIWLRRRGGGVINPTVVGTDFDFLTPVTSRVLSSFFFP